MSWLTRAGPKRLGARPGCGAVGADPSRENGGKSDRFHWPGYGENGNPIGSPFSKFQAQKVQSDIVSLRYWSLICEPPLNSTEVVDPPLLKVTR